MLPIYVLNTMDNILQDTIQQQQKMAYKCLDIKKNMIGYIVMMESIQYQPKYLYKTNNSPHESLLVKVMEELLPLQHVKVKVYCSIS